MSDAAGVFGGLTVLALAGVRWRYKSPRVLVNRHVFGSEHFSDKVILQQLADTKFQTKLEEHNWERLFELGPCYASIAEEMLRGRSIEEVLRSDPHLGPEIRQLLLENVPALTKAMCIIAESYLGRDLKKSDSRAKNASKDVPRVQLRGQSTGKLYAPVKFIARGSAGAVYTAVRVSEEGTDRIADVLHQAMKNSDGPSTTGLRDRLKAAVSMQLQRQLALKQVEPTQRSSAINEYRIASILAENDKDQTCVTYLDRLDESPQRLWLLLRRISPSPYGIDLAEYIEHQFFETGLPVYQEIAQLVVLQLLQGIDYISSRGIVMRDVKPDNVLMDYGVSMDEKIQMVARWSDFGLSIDMGRMLDGAGLRSPLNVQKLEADASGAAQPPRDTDAANLNEEALTDALVAFWYDTQKLVPKPKWTARRPPEHCFQDPTRVHVSSYDLYMMGIIIVSMALGIDVPHIDRPSVKAKFEKITSIELPNDYLHTFELGQSLREDGAKYLPFFRAHVRPNFRQRTYA
mmetsp:Transcript_14937/g.29049  ORF Transcript_14937/g.29049 Transcript_14937/m.29049 type:complete len:517 (-) Transcript_14937:284-1834(-)